jgi:hypothetical protein
MKKIYFTVTNKTNMKKLKHYSFVLLALCFMLVTSMKCKKDNQEPSKEQLPAITQTGANTFGVLLNGEVWLPKGGLLDQKLDLSYDPTYAGGSFGIIANRYVSKENKMEVRIGLTGVNKEASYYFNNNGVIYRDTKSNCNYYEDRIVSGSLTITKLDLVNKFISGTFEFKLEKNGCPTINATQGRFDLKIE